jgi:hypothetical protein
MPAAATTDTPQLTLPGHSDLSVLGIQGTDGRTVQQVNDELRQGARFVVFPYAIIRVLTGGKNVTNALVAALNENADEAAALVAKAAAAEGPKSSVLETVAQPTAPAGQSHRVVAAQQQYPARWYADPHGQARQRYWDGQAWTEHTAA